MPKIAPVLPPRQPEDAKIAFDKIFAVAKHLNIPLETEGFVRSWSADSTRVILAYDGDTPTGFGIMAFGRRYYDEKFTASVVMAQGPDRNALLEYMVNMAQVLGAEVLFYEQQDGDTLGGEDAGMRMVTIA